MEDITNWHKKYKPIVANLCLLNQNEAAPIYSNIKRDKFTQKDTLEDLDALSQDKNGYLTEGFGNGIAQLDTYVSKWK